MKYLYVLLIVVFFCFFVFFYVQILMLGLEFGYSFMYDEVVFMLLLENVLVEGDLMMFIGVLLFLFIGDFIEVVVWELDVFSLDLKVVYLEVCIFILGNVEIGQLVGCMVVLFCGLDVVLCIEIGMVVIELDEL